MNGNTSLSGLYLVVLIQFIHIILNICNGHERPNKLTNFPNVKLKVECAFSYVGS